MNEDIDSKVMNIRSLRIVGGVLHPLLVGRTLLWNG
jgi:hypothetical protein